MKKTKETYDFEYPNTAIHNLVFGKKYLWNKGELTAKNLTNGITAKINFPEKGWSSKDDYKV